MRNVKGFTLVEVMFTLAIAGLLMGLSTSAIFSAKNKASLGSSVNLLITDLKQQQLKAMIGDTEGRITSDNYGIYFEQSRYILFHGSTYSLGDTANFPVSLPGDINFTTPATSVIFSRGNGELLGSGSFALTLKNINSNEQKTLSVNKLGTVIDVN